MKYEIIVPATNPLVKPLVFECHGKDELAFMKPHIEHLLNLIHNAPNTTPKYSKDIRVEEVSS